MDALSELLLSLRPTAHVTAISELRGDWGYVTPNYPANIMFSAHVVEGHMWVRCNGGELFRLERGESVLVSGGGAIEYRASPQASAVPLVQALGSQGHELLDLTHVGTPLALRLGEGKNLCRMLSLGVLFDSHAPNPLLSILAPYRRFKAGGAGVDGLVVAAVEFLSAEIQQRRPGYGAAAAHLTEMIVTEQLRTLALALSDLTSPNIFRGLAHPQVGNALKAMYKAPGQRWTIASLAAHAAMSRATFARRFSELIGMSVHKYLTQWRVKLAEDMLHQTPRPKVGSIAAMLGYGSERAFRSAFCRERGCSPAQFVQHHKSATGMSKPDCL